MHAFIGRADLTPEIHGDALGVRAELRADTGDIDGATRDLLDARTLVGPTYSRYIHELCLAALNRRLGNREEAVHWLRTALRTCLDGSRVSGGTALSRLVDLIPIDDMIDADAELCQLAIDRSWTVLGLPGEPDRSDIRAVIDAIKRAESQPAPAPECHS